MLAIVIGYYVIGNVAHALHTPLMSVTNAISGVVIVGALCRSATVTSRTRPRSESLSAIAILVASINVFGGFAVTRRMLAMFQQRGLTVTIGIVPPSRRRPIIIAALSFILSLAGLSKHETSRSGLTFGIVGMGLALVATIALSLTRRDSTTSWSRSHCSPVPSAIGALIGLWRARIVEMTGMPELIALLHSFVGIAAVLIGWNGALVASTARVSISPTSGLLTNIHEAEIAIGIFIGAVTFTGRSWRTSSCRRG